MKTIIHLTLAAIFFVCGCSNNKGTDSKTGTVPMVSQSSVAEKLSREEIAQIKNEIIKRSERYAQDLYNLDYKAIMTFYANVEDHIIFGDGYYWGDYQTIDGIWKDFTEGATKDKEEKKKKVLKWGFYNHKIHVFSKDVASFLVEFQHEQIEANGDTTKKHWCSSFAMQKIDGDWKAVTAHVTHNYNVYDSRGEVRKWWLKYSPENRKDAL